MPVQINEQNLTIYNVTIYNLSADEAHKHVGKFLLLSLQESATLPSATADGKGMDGGRQSHFEGKEANSRSLW